MMDRRPPRQPPKRGEAVGREGAAVDRADFQEGTLAIEGPLAGAQSASSVSASCMGSLAAVEPWLGQRLGASFVSGFSKTTV